MNSPRFVNLETRSFQGLILGLEENMFAYYAQTIKHSKWNFSKWKNLTLMKDPMTITVYLNLLQELKPKTILEFGTYDGGSALWMDDMMKSLNIDCTIHTFDINEERVNIPVNTNIHFHQVDNYKIADFIANNPLFENLAHPVLVIEDAHANVFGLLNCIDKLLQSGDYLIVEDTLDSTKYKAFEKFANGKKYLVDKHYCDFWGHNNSWNINSFLKKI